MQAATACLQFVGSQNAGQRGQCSRADKIEGAEKKSELSRRQVNARRMSRAGQNSIESKEARERERESVLPKNINLK